MTADTFPALLLGHARVRAERPALREKRRGIWHTITWRELADDVSALAAGLAARGLGRGDYMAVLSDNRPRLHVAMCAAQWLGAIVVPLYRDATADELAPLLQDADVGHVFAEDQEQVDKLLAVRDRCPRLRCIVYDQDRGMRHYRESLLVGHADLLAQGRARIASAGPAALQATGEDAAFLFFTSGTTGRAKGVLLTHAALIDRARAGSATDGLSDRDVAVAYLPPAWVGQNLFSYAQPLVVGYCVCCPESSETMLADTREIGPTYFLAPPRVLQALLAQLTLRMEGTGGLKRRLYARCMALAGRVGPAIRSGRPVAWLDRLAYAAADRLIYAPLRDVLGLGRVRVAYTAGDAAGPELVSFFRSIGINLKQLYGSTETGFFVAMQRDGQVRPDTVGAAVHGVELKIDAGDEVLVRSPGLFREYHRAPQATADATSADGWFRTGDAGRLGSDGQLSIVDRLVDLGTLVDGTLLSPRLIENKLKFSPHIRDAVVFGDGRDTVCALVGIDAGTVGRWADRRSLSYTGYADLASRPEVYALIAEAVAGVNAELARDADSARAQVHRFAILPKELDADDGVLTRTGKMRRGAIAELYRPIVDALYDGSTGVRLGEEEIRIGDVASPPRPAASKVA